MAEFEKFEYRAPSIQNMIDIFEGKWASSFEGLLQDVIAGGSPLFTIDQRPLQAATALGHDSRLDGMEILELGPLEAGHTYKLELLGAKEITAIEANREAFLKCLIVKEVLNLKNSRFILGDFNEYFRLNYRRFDMVFASGVLYHMYDPVDVIHDMAKITDKCFIWTHYYDPDNYVGTQREHRLNPKWPEIDHFYVEYSNIESDNFWGGNKPSAAWLKQDDIFAAFRSAGLSDITLIESNPTHPNGPCMTFAAKR